MFAKIVSGVLALIFVFSQILMAEESTVIPCPLKGDPPPAIDGNLQEWFANPVPQEIEENNVTYGKVKWTGDDDLCGTVFKYWDKNYFYFAVDVTDDVLTNGSIGRDLWRDDHIELNIDSKWTKTATGKFGDGQFTFGFAPGNFGTSGDPLLDIEPAFYIYSPNNITEDPNIDVAAKRTETGYVLEARIPWKFLGIKPEEGLVFGFDIHLSDSDSPESQDSMTSLNPKDWAGPLRERMLPIRLSDTEGK